MSRFIFESIIMMQFAAFFTTFQKSQKLYMKRCPASWQGRGLLTPTLPYEELNVNYIILIYAINPKRIINTIRGIAHSPSFLKLLHHLRIALALRICCGVLCRLDNFEKKLSISLLRFSNINNNSFMINAMPLLYH